jgi:hypothetical protein
VLYENESSGSKTKEVEIVAAVVDTFGKFHAASSRTGDWLQWKDYNRGGRELSIFISGPGQRSAIILP